MIVLRSDVLLPIVCGNEIEPMKTILHPTRNDLPEKTRRAMVNLLNQRLADVLDLGLQAKQAHWNVKGPNFISLHELFDKVAEEMEGFADELAERAVALRRRRIGHGKTGGGKFTPPGVPTRVDHRSWARRSLVQCTGRVREVGSRGD